MLLLAYSGGHRPWIAKTWYAACRARFLFFFNFLDLALLCISLLKINLRIITLQYGDGLCHTYINMNRPQVTCPPASPNPSGWSQSAGFGCPGPCTGPAAVLQLTCAHAHASVLLSQVIPLTVPHAGQQRRQGSWSQRWCQ